AQNTMIQLVRMKVFYFLILFVVLVLVVAAAGLAWNPLEHVQAIKRWSFGAMYLFTMIYSISATALLLPRDLEDRTLYTILSKPVQRIEYLAGRLLGVFAINGLALLAMFLIMAILVSLNMGSVESHFLREFQQDAQSELVTQEEAARQMEKARSFGVTSSLVGALWSMFLKAGVISAVTLFVSTFASSTLFTIVASALMIFIGHFHQMATSYWTYEMGGNWLALGVSKLLVILFPNFGLFDVVDEVIQGTVLLGGQMLQITAFGLFYIFLFLLLAQLIFYDKEL
ncbi:MAG: hypothetical protein AAGJ31_11430, partial [Verrucomicrobiota bacterium]